MEFRKTIRFGIYAALTLIALSWINFYITDGYQPVVAQLGSFAAMLLATLWVVPAVRHVRDRLFGGKISYWRSFFVGLWTGIIAALGMFLSTLIFLAVNKERFREWSVGPEEEMQQAVVMNPVEQGIIMALLVLFIWSVVSLIYAIFLRRE